MHGRRHFDPRRPLTAAAPMSTLSDATRDLMRHRLYVVLAAVFLTALLVANMVGGKFFHLGDLGISCGVIPFPITFLLTDVVNEYYGRRGARFLTLVGMAMLVFAFVVLQVACALPPAANTPIAQDAFVAVFGMSPRFFAASILAYLLGQLIDIQAFTWFKRITHERRLWLRATGSTAISQVFDTLVVNITALYGVTSATGAPIALTTILGWAGMAYLYKMVVAVVLTPLLYVAHAVVTDRLGLRPADVDGPAPAG